MLGVSPTDLTFRYHGKYCGPNYGDPEFKEKAIDKLDEICKKHDFEYDREDADLFYADLDFANEAISEDLFSSSYFYLQSALRYLGIMARKNGKKKDKKKVAAATKEVRKEIKQLKKGFKKQNSSPVAGIRVGDSKLGRTKTKIEKNQNCHTISHDFAVDVTIATNQSLGQLITTYPLRPDQWDGTRLKQLSGLYEKWRLKRMSIEYRPAVATTEPGSFIMFYDPDPADSIGSTGAAMVQKAASAQNRVRFQCFEPKTLKCGPARGTPPMFTSFESGDDVRLSSYGNIYIVNDVGLTASASKTYGNLYITLDIEFQKPILEELPAAFNYDFEPGSINAYDPASLTIGLYNASHMADTHPEYVVASNGADNAINWITVTGGVPVGSGLYITQIMLTRPGWYMVRTKVVFQTLGDTDFTVGAAGCDLYSEYETVYGAVSGEAVWSSMVYVPGGQYYEREDNKWTVNGNCPTVTIWTFDSANPAEISEAHLNVTPLPNMSGPTFLSRKGESLDPAEIKFKSLQKELEQLKKMVIENSKPTKDTCFFCGMNNPDHLPKYCLKNPTRASAQPTK